MDEAKVPFSAVHTWSNPDEANPHSSTHPRKLSLQGRWCNIAVRLPVQEVIRSPSMSRQNRIDRDPSGSGLCSSGVLANPLDFSQTLSQGARLTRTPSHSRELGHLVHERATPRHPIHSRHPTLSSTPHNYLLSNSRFERKLTRSPRQFRTSFTSGKLGIGSTSFQIIGRSLPNLIRKRDHDGVESVFSTTFSNIHTDSLRSAFFRCSNVSNFSSIWPFLAFLPGTNDNKVSTFPGGIDLSRQALLADPRSRVQQPVPSLEMAETVKKIYIYIFDDEEKLNRESARRRNRNGRSRHWSGGNARPTFVVSNSGNVFKLNDPSFFFISPRLFFPMLLRGARYFRRFYPLFCKPLFTASK